MKSGMVQSVARIRSLLPPALRQAIKFGSVGVINTLLDALVYFILTRWLGMMNQQTLAKAISYSVGMVNSFYWNKTWTFRSKKQTTLRMAGLFILLNLVSLAVNAGMMALGLHVLHLPELLAFILATLAALGWNFFTTRRFVFHDQTGQLPAR